MLRLVYMLSNLYFALIRVPVAAVCCADYIVAHVHLPTNSADSKISFRHRCVHRRINFLSFSLFWLNPSEATVEKAAYIFI